MWKFYWNYNRGISILLGCVTIMCTLFGAAIDLVGPCYWSDDVISGRESLVGSSTCDDTEAENPPAYGVRIGAVDRQLLRYNRSELYALRRSAGRPDLDTIDGLGLLRYRRVRGERHVHMRKTRARNLVPVINLYDTSDGNSPLPIPVIINNRRQKRPRERDSRTLINVSKSKQSVSKLTQKSDPGTFIPPSIYVINATSIRQAPCH